MRLYWGKVPSCSPRAMSHFRTSTTTGEGKQRGGGKIRLPSSEGRFSPPHLLTFSLLVSSRWLSHEWGVECTGEALLEKLLSCSPRSTSHVLTFSPSHFHTSIHPRHLACVRVPTQGFSHHCGCFDRPGPRPLCYTARLTPPLIPPPSPTGSPWLGTCVGRRNYQYFLWFLLSTTLYCIFVFCGGCGGGGAAVFRRMGNLA